MATGFNESREWIDQRDRAQIRAAPDAIITIDDQGQVVEWNPAAERVFGYPAAEAIGAELAALIVPDRMADAHRKGMTRYFLTGHGPALDQRLELPGRRSDGTEITVELTITAFEAEGRQWFTGYARDISQVTEMRRALELSEQRFRAIVEGSSDVITILDADGSWRYTSGAGTRLTGYEKGFDPDGGIFSLLHPDDLELAARVLQEIISGTRSETEPVELRIIDAEGTIHWFETTGVNMLADPAVEGIVLHARDVTDRRAADDAVRLKTGQLAGVMGMLEMGVLVEDEDRHVVTANETFADLLESPVPAEEMAGADCAIVAHGSKTLFTDPDGFIEGIERALDGKRPVRGDRLVTTSGRHLERDYVPVMDLGRVKGHIWLYRDVTEERELQMQREAMLELERETRVQVERQNEALRELDELKTQLVATVSHELRTPLASIISFSDLLSHTLDETADPDSARFVDTIQRNADRLMQLVDDLLLLARLESRAVDLQVERIDIGELARGVVDNARPGAESRAVTLTVTDSGDAKVAADRSKLIQVLDNLVSNAIKFTPDGGDVAVRAERTAGGVDIVVADTGIGIPADDLPLLFSRFFRAANARTAMVPGTGLGLAVTRGLVELHGGTIKVESEQDEGTVFTVFIPGGEDA